MTPLIDRPLHTLADIRALEAEMPFEQRVPARSVYELLRRSAERFSEHTALTFLQTGEPAESPRTLSYRELLRAVTQAANLFRHVGGPAAGVAYMLPSLIETHVTLWGAETAGYAVPINYLLQAEHIVDLVRASGASVLVALGPHSQLDIWSKAEAVAAALPGLTLLQVSAADADSAGGRDFTALLAEQDSERLTFPVPGRDDIAAYFHTGGTTGVPKLVAHTHRNQIVAAFGAAALLHYTPQDVMTLGIPLFHVGGTIACGLAALMAGTNILLLTPVGMRSPVALRNYWRIVQEHRVTVLGAAPPSLGALLNVPVDADISSARISMTGGTSTPHTVIERWQALTHTQLHQVYGMSETGGVIAITPEGNDAKLSSVGLPIPYTRVRVRRAAVEGGLGDDCAPKEVGVLTIEGPTVTPGYRGQPRETASYLNSGDLAYADAQGHLFIAGRAKDLIIRSGHNIDPMMIESAFQAHPAVELAAAVGQPDRYAGEVPVVYVMMRPGAQATAEDLRDFALPRIHERPAWPKQVILLDALPLTAVGKIFKPQLRADAARRLIAATVAETIGSPDAKVAVAMGGPRGMTVTVVLPASQAAQRANIEALLAGYLFETVVRS